MRRFCNNIGKPVWILTKSEVVDIIFSSKTEPENHFWLSWSNEGILKTNNRTFLKKIPTVTYQLSVVIIDGDIYFTRILNIFNRKCQDFVLRK